MRNPLSPADPLESIPPERWNLRGCAYEDLLVPQVFRRVERDLEQLADHAYPLVVTFDEQSGYVTEYHLGRASGRGLFAPVVSECCTWFIFENLRSIESP